MSNSSQNTDDDSDSEQHNAFFLIISLQNVSLLWPNYSKYFFTKVFEKYSKDFLKYLSCI
jgi:hypothetical protein